MVVFQIADMTCGHCVGSITQAVQRVDADATVRADVATHRVEIYSSSAGAATLQAAIQEAGFTPVPA